MTSSPRWVKLNREYLTECFIKVEDLIEGSSYEFRVIAENLAGPGAPSQPSRPITAKDPWGELIILFVVGDFDTLDEQQKSNKQRNIF
jgi:hypothetical protein